MRCPGDRLSCNTARIRSFEPLVPPLGPLLIAAFCRLDKSLRCCWEKGLVGVVVGNRTLALGNETQCRGKQVVESASRPRL
jgi:hypothetical protein